MKLTFTKEKKEGAEGVNYCLNI